MTREEAIADIRDNIKPVVGGKSLDMAIEALEQEPCEDCISRQAAIEAVKQAIYNHDSVIMRLTDLPSVTPQPITLEKAIDYLHEIGWMQEHDKEMAQLNRKIKQEPKVGEWLKNGELCKCSNCHSNVLFSAIKLYDYCYHCGAKMV